MRIERQIVFWLGAAVVLFGIVALLRDVLLPFVVATVVAYFLNPLADRLQSAGLGRTLAAALVLASVGIIVILAALLLAPFIASQLRQIAETLPADIARMKIGIDGWLQLAMGSRYPWLVTSTEKALVELQQTWTASAGVIARALWSQGLAIVNFLSLLLITPVVVFYLLVDWHPMLEKIDGWLPRDHAGTIRRLAAKMNEAIAAFIRGQGTICIILGALYAIGLTWIGLPYGLLIGIASGILAIVPFVGWTLGLLTAGGLAIAHGGPDQSLLLKTVGVYALGMALDSAVLSPKIVGSRIGLHPVWLMLSIFAFSYLFGFVGLLVAVPVAAAVGVLVRFGLDAYLASPVYRGRGLESSGNSGIEP